jgi:hypothetical protein
MEEKFPPFIITGSSRVSPMGSGIIGVPCLNMFVSSASLEDHIALAVAAQKKRGTKAFLLGVDPWVFNENLGPTRWRSISDEYFKGLQTIGISRVSGPKARDNKYLQLINYEYTKAAINLLLHPAKTLTATAGESPEEDRALIRYDGSRVESRRTSEPSVDVINNLAREYAKPPVYNLANFRFSNKNMGDFLKLVDYLEKDSHVVFVLPPYHPLAYPLINQAYPEICNIEKMLREEAAKRSISVIGSYDPQVIGCEETDFSDGMHPTARCWEKIISESDWGAIVRSIRGNETSDSTGTNNHVQ